MAGGVMVESAVAPAFNVVAFAGSLRRGSYNSALLRETKELAPPMLHIVIDELDAIPLYNGDIEAAGAPPSVVQLRDAVRQSDALLIATPEYTHGVPGVLKNTIDWLSRPPRDNALNGKAAALIAASPGMTGTRPGATAAGVRSHEHLSSLRCSSPTRTRSSTPRVD